MKRRHILSALLIIISVHGENSALEYYRYFAATYNQYRNNTESARDWYNKLLNNSMPIHAYKGYLELLFAQGKHAAITQLMPHVQKILNANPDMQHLCAHALARTGKVKEADELLIQAAQQHKAHQEVIFYAAQAYMRRKEPENALKIVDTLLNSTPRMPSHYAFYFLKSQIYTSLNQINHAIESMEKCIKINPSFHKGRLMLALLHKKKSSVPNKIEGTNSPIALLHTLILQKNYPKAFKLLQAWITRDPHNPHAHAYLGSLYAQQNNFMQALKHMRIAFSISSDLTLKTTLSLAQARIYHKKKEYNSMVTILEEGYKLGQNYAPLLNLLAYSYAKQRKKLDTAMNLIKDALQQDPNNPYYQDTQAIILYAQGEYAKAQTILEVLVRKIPTDKTIVSHLNKVLDKQIENNSSRP